jgi:hypothetical protein
MVAGSIEVSNRTGALRIWQIIVRDVTWTPALASAT